ncbi:MAG TPA: zinc ribbon domain-containing protein [Chloroflexota bacterium]
MTCRHCHHSPPERSRFCNMCGAAMPPDGQPAGPVARRLEQRRIFIDLADLHITGYLGDPGHRATVTAAMYERFTPFADDGWEWIVHPGEPTFDGWVYEHVDGRLTVLGVHVLCQRVRWPDPNWVDPTHHVSEYRVLQLTGTAWTAAEGSKVWKPIER